MSWVCRYDCDGRTIKPQKNRQTPEKLTSSNTSVSTLAGLYRHRSIPNAFKEKKKGHAQQLKRKKDTHREKEKRTRTAIEAVSTES